MDMPKYRMINAVSAAKVAFVTDDQIHVHIGETVVGVGVSRENMELQTPVPGEYLVKHADGRLEMMVADDFEALFARV